MRRTSASARAGFALPMVLGVVAVLSLVLLTVALAVEGSQAGARRALEVAAFERDAFSAEARTAYIAATFPLRVRSVGQLPIDGSLVATGGGRGLRLQDEAGLVNLDASREDALLRLFGYLGLSAQASETLRDRLLDAIDADSTRRPRGAEAAEYRLRGWPGPPNHALATAPELDGVLDWAQLVGAARRPLSEVTTVDPASSTFNPETAPPLALAAVLAMSPQAAGRLREARPAGVESPPGGRGRPNGRFRFAFVDPVRRLSYTSRWTRAAPDADRPLLVDEGRIERSPPVSAAPR